VIDTTPRSFGDPRIGDGRACTDAAADGIGAIEGISSLIVVAVALELSFGECRTPCGECAGADGVEEDMVVERGAWPMKPRVGEGGESGEGQLDGCEKAFSLGDGLLEGCCDDAPEVYAEEPGGVGERGDLGGGEDEEWCLTSGTNGRPIHVVEVTVAVVIVVPGGVGCDGLSRGRVTCREERPSREGEWIFWYFSVGDPPPPPPPTLVPFVGCTLGAPPGLSFELCVMLLIRSASAAERSVRATGFTGLCMMWVIARLVMSISSCPTGTVHFLE
jgi:hypothetical protein